MNPPIPTGEPAAEDGRYSVGELAAATGIAPGTLRMWEQRYGAPIPVRLPSGHRRYTDDHMRLVRRVAEAMAHGHRPGKLLRSSEEELDLLLASSPGVEETPPEIAPWLECVRRYDEHGLQEAMHGAAATLTPLEFLQTRVSPFVRAVGRLWSDGKLDVHHEHFASQTIETVLRSLRTSLRERPDRVVRGRIVLTTLPEERHGLGLLMAAMLCEANGVHTHLLGTDTPLDEIVASAREHSVDAVGVGVSLASGGLRADALLAELRASLPDHTTLMVGGAGALGKRRRLKGVTYCVDLVQLERWLQSI